MRDTLGWTWTYEKFKGWELCGCRCFRKNQEEINWDADSTQCEHSQGLPTPRTKVLKSQCSRITEGLSISAAEPHPQMCIATSSGESGCTLLRTTILRDLFSKLDHTQDWQAQIQLRTRKQQQNSFSPRVWAGINSSDQEMKKLDSLLLFQ